MSIKYASYPTVPSGMSPPVPEERRLLLSGMLSEKRLASNVVWNLFCAGVPLAFAVWAIPKLITVLGTDRFGILALIWAAIGYFTLFDMGLGRALTKLVAERLGDGRDAEIVALARAGIAIVTSVGAAVGACVALLAPAVVGRLLAVPSVLRHEATISVAIAGLTLPIVLSTTALIGLLQARQRFLQLSIVQMTLGVVTYAGPLLALRVSASLVPVTLVLSASRIVAWVVYRSLCRDLLHADGRPQLTPTLRRELFRFGGWVTVSNVIGPLMVYLDRFLIAAVMTTAAVAYYTTPFEMVSRLWVAADALVAVVFPAIATALAAGRRDAQFLFLRAIRAMTLLMALPVGLIILFAREILTLWLGPTFASSSAPVLRWLAFGVFLNGVARLPFAAVQASGRPQITAKLHAIELPIYVSGLWLLIRSFGIVGAAEAWTFRISIDAGVLFTYCLYLIPEMRHVQMRVIRLITAATLLLGLLALIDGIWFRAAGAFVLVAAGLYFCFVEVRNLVTSPVAIVAS